MRSNQERNQSAQNLKTDSILFAIIIQQMSEDGVKKSADPRVSLVTGCIAGKKTTVSISKSLFLQISKSLISYL